MERRSGAVLLSTPRAPFQRALETPGREGEVGGWSSQDFQLRIPGNWRLGIMCPKMNATRDLLDKKELSWCGRHSQFSEALKEK